ncbi:MAG TPA: hypothetical protein VF594_07630 [Rubricoccaceae bacterium]
MALVGLLASSLAIGGGDSKNPQSGEKPAPDNAVPGIFISSDASATPAATPLTIQDTYAFGRENSASPLRLWASYAHGTVDRFWNTSGDSGGDAGNIQIAGTDGEIESQRAIFGGEIGLPVRLFGFGIGAGAQLTLAQNQFQVEATQTPGNNPPIPGFPAAGFIATDLDSGFKLQGVKVYGAARAGAIGLHGGYVFDLGQERTYGPPVAALGGAVLPTNLSNSDGRDAIFVGADFDYPSERLRLFGAVDYYLLQQGGENNPNTAADESTTDGDDIMQAMLGLGFRASIFELGAALQIQARLSQPLVGGIGTQEGIGASAATIAPYLRISPPQIPASVFIKGAVLEEYTEFGYALGGSNSPKPKIGFTAGLTFGFD